jgi:hypothetical protein
LGLFYVFLTCNKYTKYFPLVPPKIILTKKQTSSTSIPPQATPPLRTARLFFGVSVFLQWVPRFFGFLHLLPFLCGFGFGAWVGLGWLALAIPFAVGWLGWVSIFVCSMVGGLGGMY